MFTRSKNERMSSGFLPIGTNQGRRGCGKGRVFLHLEAVKGRSKGRLQFTSLHQFFKRYFVKSYLGRKELDFLSPIFHSGIRFCTPLSTPVQLRGWEVQLPKLAWIG